MTQDPTAGRSAGTPLNAELDPMGRSDTENRRLSAKHQHEREPEPEPEREGEQADQAGAPTDPTAGRPAGDVRHPEQDPTRFASHRPRP